ncbi:hypothetical protein H920_11519 [Fukomys damarensis]|uniref:Uncharacterized protein n=1 Tax=Fukomys damarensis TaxID=885580 RepID=A0A091D4U4_FUKDA|nr:hypothetical protein H920_11519 [Fukomys damarensis]
MHTPVPAPTQGTLGMFVTQVNDKMHTSIHRGVVTLEERVKVAALAEFGMAGPQLEQPDSRSQEEGQQ